MKALFALEFFEVETLAAIAIGLLVAYIVFRTSHWATRGGRRRAAPPFVADPAEPLAPDQAERRQFARRGGSPVPVLIADPQTKQNVRKGAVLDRSQGGLRLLVDESATVGQIVAVRPESAGTLLPWVEMEVRRCHRTGKGWEWGCQFNQSVPTSVMWLFG
jgi:PilZ domain